MAAVVATTLDVIFLALQAQLVAKLAWPAERVLIVPPEVLDALGYDPQADQYLWIWEAQSNPDQGRFAGAGRFDLEEIVRVEIGVRTRYGADEATSRALWLADPSATGLGHVTNRHAVLNALAEFNPTDTNGNALTVGGLFDPANGRPRIDKTAKEWGESVLVFSLRYALATNPTTPL